MILLVKLQEARSAESVSAVDHYTRKILPQVVFPSAERAPLAIQQLADKLVYSLIMLVFLILGLLEEIFCGVDQLLHSNWFIKTNYFTHRRTF